jgi:protein phosphatase
MNVQMWAVSDVGRVRKSNEDSFYVSHEDNLLIVCDGMGGQVAGSLASRLAVETIKDFFVAPPDRRLAQVIEDVDPKIPEHATRLVLAVRMANRRLYDMARRHAHLRGMGTTVAAITFTGGVAAMVHVGDSRIYRLRRGKLSQLTSDHSWVQELLDDEEISQEEVDQFAKRNVITRALGVTPTVKIDVRYERTKPGDCYLLCSDGLHGALGYSELLETLKSQTKDFEGTARALIEQAKEADGSDNITVALGKVWDVGDHTVPNFSLSLTVADEPEKVISKESKLLRQRYSEQRPSAGHRLLRYLPRDRLSIAATVVCTIAIVMVFLLVRTYVSGKASVARTSGESDVGFFSRLKERTLAVSDGQEKRPSRNAIALSPEKLEVPSPVQKSGGYLLLLYVPDLETTQKIKLPDSVAVLGRPILIAGKPEPATSVVVTLTDQENKVLSSVRNRLPEPPKP